MPWIFPYLGETKSLNEATRSSAPGSFLQLSDGCTHYELGGQQSGGPVVLVHGFSVPYFIWDPTFDFLAVSGFRVLRYDLFGRGYSDRPKIRYDIDLFCKQLRELTDTLGFKRMNLIGLSMGGPITATFSARYPERVGKLVLIDPAGVRPIILAKAFKAEIMPGISGLAPGLFESGHRSKAVELYFDDPAHVKAFAEKYMVQMKYKGFLRAILSTIRNSMLGDFSSAYRQIGEMGLPTLLFWGRQDETVPFEQNADLCAAIPQAEFHAIENCGHAPHYEKPGEVDPILLEFLK